MRNLAIQVSAAWVIAASLTQHTLIDPWKPLAQGNWSVAEARLRDALAERESPDLRVSLAYCLDFQNRPHEAYLEYQRAFEDDNRPWSMPQTHPLGLIRLAELSRLYGDPQRAETLFLESYLAWKRAQENMLRVNGVSMEPNILNTSYQPEAWDLLFAAEKSAGQQPPHMRLPGAYATRYLAQAIRLEPRWTYLWMRYAEAYSSINHNGKAYAAFREVVRIAKPSELKMKQGAQEQMDRLDRTRRGSTEVDENNVRIFYPASSGPIFREEDRQTDPGWNTEWPLTGPVPPDWH